MLWFDGEVCPYVVDGASMPYAGDFDHSKTSEPKGVMGMTGISSEVASVPFGELLVRYRQCVEGGHVWRPLADNPHGPGEAEYCG